MRKETEQNRTERQAATSMTRTGPANLARIIKTGSKYPQPPAGALQHARRCFTEKEKSKRGNGRSSVWAWGAGWLSPGDGERRTGGELRKRGSADGEPVPAGSTCRSLLSPPSSSSSGIESNNSFEKPFLLPSSSRHSPLSFDSGEVAPW